MDKEYLLIESTGILGKEEARRAALERLEVPTGYLPRGVAWRDHGSRQVWHFRYEKATGENRGLGGEHFSFTVDVLSGEILGVTWMDGRFSPQALPEGEEAQAVAGRFLGRVSPGLRETLTTLWVDRHDETVVIDGEQFPVSGTKVKMRRDFEGDYAWVIVGRGSPEDGGEPLAVTFERDIVWDSAAGHRATQFWLSDDYLAWHVDEHHPTLAKIGVIPATDSTATAREESTGGFGEAVEAFRERGARL